MERRRGASSVDLERRRDTVVEVLHRAFLCFMQTTVVQQGPAGHAWGVPAQPLVTCGAARPRLHYRLLILCPPALGPATQPESPGFWMRKTPGGHTHHPPPPSPRAHDSRREAPACDPGQSSHRVRYCPGYPVTVTLHTIARTHSLTHTRSLYTHARPRRLSVDVLCQSRSPTPQHCSLQHCSQHCSLERCASAMLQGAKHLREQMHLLPHCWSTPSPSGDTWAW